MTTKNTSTYPQEYLDRMLPHATCPNCMSSNVSRTNVRDAGQYQIVTNLCNDCNVDFIVRYHVPTLVKQRHESLERMKREKRNEEVQKPNKNPVPRIYGVKKENKNNNSTTTNKKITKKSLYDNISRGFDTASLVIVLISLILVAFECYDLFALYNANQILYIIITVFASLSLIVITQTFSIIYKFMGNRAHKNIKEV